MQRFNVTLILVETRKSNKTQRRLTVRTKGEKQGRTLETLRTFQQTPNEMNEGDSN